MTENKRGYKKRSDYWEKFRKTEASMNGISSPLEDFVPELSGESFYESVKIPTKTSYASRTELRTNAISSSFTTKRYKNIDDGLLPFDYSSDSVDARDAIQLCQRAYFNVPAFRSTIDLLSEFADSDIYLEGGSEKGRKFIEAWFKRIKLHDIKAQYFREYYRSGNVFMYRLDGKIKTDEAQKVLEAYGAETVRAPIPIKYLMLNPSDIATKGSISFSQYQYFKVLTPYEISRLREPKTDYEKELFNSMPKDVQVRIKTGVATTSERLYIQLDSDLLHVIFYKKQDYEPLSIPMGFPVLDDINKKLELKKIDQAIARSIENVVLLVTMGAEPEKGGINQKNLMAMQQIFKNQSVGRVLVSDYTTKADFVIPDLRKVIGKEKYEVLNKDIEEGLQNILIGESKYADTQLKLKIFMQRLDEARDLFIKEFLQPEIKKLCKAMGMKNWPIAKFVKTDTLDNSDLQKLVTRMMELGVLTPEQGIQTINSGVFPSVEDMSAAQDKFKNDRDKGHYMPLVNSINLYQQDGATAPVPSKTVKTPAQKPIPTVKTKTATTSSPSGGRPMGTSKATGEFSRKNIIGVTKLMNEFEFTAYSAFAQKYGVEELEESKKELVSNVCESIIGSKEFSEWDSTLASIVDDLDLIQDLDLSPNILEIGAKHQLDDLSAAILYHSNKITV
jgi:hypothetical protein